MSTTLYLHGSTIKIAAGALATLGEQLKALAPDRRVAIVADQTVGPLYGGKAMAAVLASGMALGATAGGTPAPGLYTFPTGEQHKTRLTWAALTDQLIAAGYRRDTAIVALGGGVTGDMAGFVAATFMRGVPVIQVPTSLLAMIDASIGGKVGVDTQHGKNLVGAFHQPVLVLTDPTLLRTLPPQDMRSGLAEAIKHGVIADEAYFGWIAASLREILHSDGLDDETALHLVQRSAEIKVDVVARDERENGLRKVLNFGHTIGHAIEHVTGYGVSHGDAVSMGMVAEARLAERMLIAKPGLTDTIATVLDAAGLPVRLPLDVDRAEIVTATRTDKKSRAGQVEYVLPEALGKVASGPNGPGIAVPEADVLRALQHL